MADTRKVVLRTVQFLEALEQRVAVLYSLPTSNTISAIGVTPFTTQWDMELELSIQDTLPWTCDTASGVFDHCADCCKRSWNVDDFFPSKMKQKLMAKRGRVLVVKRQLVQTLSTCTDRNEPLRLTSIIKKLTNRFHLPVVRVSSDNEWRTFVVFWRHPCVSECTRTAKWNLFVKKQHSDYRNRVENTLPLLVERKVLTVERAMILNWEPGLRSPLHRHTKRNKMIQSTMS